MRVYETIIAILEEKGPLPIPTICQEVNQILTPLLEKPLLPSHIKSIVTRKKELFHKQDGRVSINQDKYPTSLIATIEGFEGISYRVHVNFIMNQFISMEWRNKDNLRPFTDFQSKSAGSIEEFKRELYAINIWEWEPSYQKEGGIVLEGKYWSVRLTSKGKVYESKGMELYPPNWNRLCKAIERLTGRPFM